MFGTSKDLLYVRLEKVSQDMSECDNEIAEYLKNLNKMYQANSQKEFEECLSNESKLENIRIESMLEAFLQVLSKVEVESIGVAMQAKEISIREALNRI